MEKKFKSINHPNEYGYAFDSMAFDVNATVNDDFRMFQTYGDGLTQHSGRWSITTEYLADYLASLTAAMLELDGDELAQYLYYTMLRKPADKDIEFAASVVFKPAEGCTVYEKKTRYYSVKERKITSSPSKEYDKRYERVESRHDGTPKAIYSMLAPEYTKGLEQYQTATAIREYLFAHDGYMELPAVFLGWTKDNDAARDLMHAFEACVNVCESYRLREAGKATIESMKRNAERKREREQESSTAA